MSQPIVILKLHPKAYGASLPSLSPPTPARALISSGRGGAKNSEFTHTPVLGAQFILIIPTQIKFTHTET